jgi:glycosyltransferase involved in cell wall biosynthesis
VKIVVDGVIYSLQSAGGISRMFRDLLPHICALDEDLNFDLYVSKPYRQQLPEHDRIQYRQLMRRVLRPTRIFEALRPQIDKLLLSLTLDRKDTWFSTYHTLPPVPMKSVITPVYDLVYERFPEMFNRDGEKQLRQQIKQSIIEADLVVCISQTTANDVLDRYDISPEKVTVIPLAANTFFQKLEPQEIVPVASIEKPFLLYVGARLKHKNFSELLEAYSSWVHRHEVDLVVVGGAWSPEEKQRLIDLDVDSKVRLLMNANDDLLRSLYNQALAFVYPSSWEGFGIPLLEAIRCGCPIICSNIASNYEVAGDYPVYFELGQPSSLHQAMDEVLLNQSGQASRLEQATLILEKYSWDNTARRLIDVFRTAAT